MSKIVFIPLTDEMVFERPEMITGPITAYKAATSKVESRCLNTKSLLADPRTYLKGDMVNGFDVVYSTCRPIKKAQS